MKSVLLIGVGKFGSMVLRQLHLLGHEIMAVDLDEKKIQDALPYVTNAQIGDSTEPEFLKSLGINNYDLCIVAIGGDFQSSLETTYLLKEMGAKQVVARAEREVQEKFLLRNGADYVVNPERQVANWTAIRYTSEHILDYIVLDDEHGVYEVSVPKEWEGKTISQIDIRKRYGINIMAIKEGGHMNLTVEPDLVLGCNKTLLVLGSHKAIQKAFRI